MRVEGKTKMKARTEVRGAQGKGRGSGSEVGPEVKWSCAQEQSGSEHRGENRERSVPESKSEGEDWEQEESRVRSS